MSAKGKDDGKLEEPTVTFNPKMPMDKLKVADENVRKHKREAGLDDLANSLSHLGLIQPIIVVPKGDKFEVIVGQRRFLAAEKLGWKEIKALIVGKLDPKTMTMYSFSENIHRRNLPYDDTILVCDVLFKDKKGTRTERIREIAAELGISYGTVRKYLAHQLVPKEVRKMVADGLMSATLAERITNAFWPNDKRILAVAKEMRNLTADEFDRLLKLGAANPDKPLEALTEEAKESPEETEITITISANAKKWYEDEAKRRAMTFNELVQEAIDDFMEAETEG